jgi:uncharacterized protein
MTLHNRLNLVIDTNVLLVSIPSRSSYHWFFQALHQKKFNAFVTTEILAEYEEIVSTKLGSQTAGNLIRMLVELDNVFHTTVYFKYQLIPQDPDDDKFVDCAINSNAHFIVTHDKHFEILERVAFPRIKTITLDVLQKILIQVS